MLTTRLIQESEKADRDRGGDPDPKIIRSYNLRSLDLSIFTKTGITPHNLLRSNNVDPHYQPYMIYFMG